MKCISLLFNGMSNGQSKIINYCGHDVQLFKYKIKNEQYYILSSITEDISINEIKALYWKRWKIETDNKKFKYNILLNNVRSKIIIHLWLTLRAFDLLHYCQQLLNILEKTTGPDIKLTQNMSLSIIEQIPILVFYEKNTLDVNKRICEIVGVIYKIVTIIVKNRSYKRIRISPSTK